MATEKTKRCEPRVRISKTARVALVVLGVAAVLIAVGVALGQPVRVWQKAALICFECIGLG